MSGLNTGVENDMFWSGEPGGTPPPRIPRSTPGAFRSEKKDSPVYYDQRLSEMHSFSPLQKSHHVNRSPHGPV